MEKIKKEYLEIIESHLSENVSSNKEKIRILLFELVRRLLISKDSLVSKGFTPKNKLLFGFVSTIKGLDFESDNLGLFHTEGQIDFNFVDKFMLNSYFNFKYNLPDEDRLCFGVYTNPYEPYVEVLRLGGKLLKYQHNRIEVFPSISILLYPLEEFETEIPYWIKEP